MGLGYVFELFASSPCAVLHDDSSPQSDLSGLRFSEHVLCLSYILFSRKGPDVCVGGSGMGNVNDYKLEEMRKSKTIE